MLNVNQIKEIVADSIKSAVCIDDQYAEPYQIDPTKDSQSSASLYHSFREDGKCDLDIYNYKSHAEFEIAKKYLFCNKELVVLDWELSTDKQINYSDSLKILSDTIKNEFIQFVTIYTQSTNFNDIIYKIYSYFTSTENKTQRNKRYEKISDEIDTLLTENSSDLSVDDLEKLLKKNIYGYTLNEEYQKEIEKEIRVGLPKGEQNKICNGISIILKNNGFEKFSEFYIWYELYLNDKDEQECIREDNELFSVKTLCIKNETPALIINNTVVFVIEKQKNSSSAIQGITPEHVFDRICEIIAAIENCRSLILSLRLKLILNQNLAILGKGLGGLNEEALVYHANSYDDKTNEGRFEYLISCLSNHITQSVVENLNYDRLETLFKEEVPPNPSDEQLAALNTFLTFTHKTKMRNPKHQLKTGDIFKIETPIINENTSEPNIEYIICVTQSCDSLRPEKINYNFAFTCGKKIPISTALSNVQTRFYSFINKNEAIEWNNRFFTLNLKENHVFNINEDIPITLYDGKAGNLEYIGNQKEIFSQRIINETFNYASRMGVDLPEKKQKNN